MYALVVTTKTQTTTDCLSSLDGVTWPRSLLTMSWPVMMLKQTIRKIPGTTRPIASQNTWGISFRKSISPALPIPECVSNRARVSFEEATRRRYRIGHFGCNMNQGRIQSDEEPLGLSGWAQ